VGGGNAKLLKTLPPDTRLVTNANAFVGGVRLWDQEAPRALQAEKRRASR
jgi:polyphosphate glucokinase